MRTPPVDSPEGHSDVLCSAGHRHAQSFSLDTRQPEFAEECRRQCRLVTDADKADTDLQNLLDEALAGVSCWAG